jgi:hypothetical protein
VHADEFAGMDSSLRQPFAINLAQKAANKAVRKPKELQIPIAREVDISLKSRNLNDGGLLTGKKGERVYVTEVPRGRASWTLANEYENSLIAHLDAKRNPQPEPETDFECCVRLLGTEDANFYWSYRTDTIITRQRSEGRTAKTPAEKKRFQRLCKLLPAYITLCHRPALKV